MFGAFEESSTLLSLLGLLHPSEFFVTVDHSVLWQRHIAWSKPKGEDLKAYVTQRFATNMVFLSCLLAAEINVFFNSSRELTDMRSLLGTRAHAELRYWIGVTIIMDACVTLVALVTTFTLWGMVSSISDTNTHALLRSSIGQYVTSLPSKFTVAALYLFLLWIVLFIINLLSGPIQLGLVLMVLGMFFQVIIPLSAFGRLIIHTGAMAKRPVLDEELEKELLPSGLHASLLIRATDRRRKYANAQEQYRKQNMGSRKSGASQPSIYYQTSQPSGLIRQKPRRQSSHSSLPQSSLGQQPYQHPPRTISTGHGRTDSDELTDDDGNSEHILNRVEEGAILQTAHASAGDQGGDDRHLMQGHHRRIETVDTVGSENFFFPRASVLNATLSRRDIQDVVQKSINLSSMGGDGLTSNSLMTNTNSLTYTLDSGRAPAKSPPNMEGAVFHSDGTWTPRTAAAPAGNPAEMYGAVFHSDGTWTPPKAAAAGIPPSNAKVFDAPPIPPSNAKVFDAPLPPAADSTKSNGHYSTKSNGHTSKMAIGILPQPEKELRSPVPKSSSARKPPAPPPFFPRNSPSPNVDSRKQPARREGPKRPYSNRSPSGSFDNSYMQKTRHSNRIPSVPFEATSNNISSQNTNTHPLDAKPSVLGNRHHHRRRSSASRRSSGSLLTLLSTPMEEWEAENEVRAVFDAPPAADMDKADQLLDDLEAAPFTQNYLPMGSSLPQIVSSDKSFDNDEDSVGAVVVGAGDNGRKSRKSREKRKSSTQPESTEEHQQGAPKQEDDEDAPEESTSLLANFRPQNNYG
jgi:hypothetical protein